MFFFKIAQVREVHTPIVPIDGAKGTEFFFTISLIVSEFRNFYNLIISIEDKEE